MKTKIAAALIAIAAMVSTACEQHKWNETSQLFKPHGEHAAHGESHGDAKAGEHGKADTHGKTDAHAEKAKH